MRRSTDRILVSHAGNLPRPPELDELIDGGKDTSGANRAEYLQRLPKAVQWIVDRQIDCGVDIVNDGEYAKAGSYGGYMQGRVTGYSTVPFDPSTARRSAPAPPSATGVSSRASTPPASGSPAPAARFGPAS